MVDPIFSAGRVGALSAKLFSIEKFHRMAECHTLFDALKILNESDYGEHSISPDENNYSTILQNELDSTVVVLKELTSDLTVSDCFLLQYDYLNAKMMMKAKYLRVDCLSDCYSCGRFDKESMWAQIAVDDYDSLSSQMRDACEKIDFEFSEGNRSPGIIDLYLDKAMFEEIAQIQKKCKVKTIKDFFAITADTTNVLSLLRAKKANCSVEKAQNLIVSGGTLPESDLMLAYAENLDRWHEHFVGDYQLLVLNAVEAINANKSLYDSERQAEQMKIDVLTPNKNELTIEPLICYYLSKRAEIDNIKIILVGIKNKLDPNEIKSKLKVLYV